MTNEPSGPLDDPASWEIGTHLDLAKIERELRAALAKLGHPAAPQPARSPVEGVGRPQG